MPTRAASSNELLVAREDHAAIAQLSAALPLRPDGDTVRCILAEAFTAHIDDLWPNGHAEATPLWIIGHVDLILATVERLYAVALDKGHPGSAEFLDRMAWLPRLVREIERDPKQRGA
jgi:hypothetical protein